MSDLAPFMAAALRDRVIQEMMDEIRDLKETNQVLRQELRDDSLKLQVTGRNGSPVYGWRYLDDATKKVKESDATGLKDSTTPLIGFVLNDNCFMPWRTFENDLEIRLGKVVLMHHQSVNVLASDNFRVEAGVPSGGRKEFWIKYNESPIWGITGELEPSRGGGNNRNPLRELSNMEQMVVSRDARVKKIQFSYAYIEELIRPYLVDADGRQIPRSHTRND
jgi:hypothetical protein